MANTEVLGKNFRGKAWNDGEPILRVTLPNGTVAEGMAALGYMWDAGTGTFVKMIGDATNGLKVQIASGGGGAATIADGADVTQGALADAAVITDTSGTLSGKLRGLVKHAYERMPTSLGQKAMSASLPVVLASDQSSIPVAATPPTLTKGTQGATGFSVQRLNDAGRNTRIFMLDTYATATNADAVVQVVQWYGNAAVAATNQPAVVPAGKTLRLTGYKMFYQSLATVGFAVVRIRCNTGGLGVIGSPLVASFEAGSGAGATTVAMTGGCTVETGSFPEGLEIPAASGLAFSVAGYGPAGVLTAAGGIRFEVHGYEY